MSSARERIPAVATADFVEACSGLVVTPEQQRYLRWFAEMMDQPTLNAFADVIRIARAEVPNEA